jgi:hypothetical protein
MADAENPGPAAWAKEPQMFVGGLFPVPVFPRLQRRPGTRPAIDDLIISKAPTFRPDSICRRNPIIHFIAVATQLPFFTCL